MSPNERIHALSSDRCRNLCFELWLIRAQNTVACDLWSPLPSFGRRLWLGVLYPMYYHAFLSRFSLLRLFAQLPPSCSILVVKSISLYCTRCSAPTPGWSRRMRVASRSDSSSRPPDPDRVAVPVTGRDKVCDRRSRADLTVRFHHIL